jgi:metal-sulfur cluster biosynthetic enzyme
LHTVYDPEIPVNIYELGLIYEVNVLPINNLQVVMTLTSPSLPGRPNDPVEVDQKLREIEGVNDVHVALTVDACMGQEYDVGSSSARIRNVINEFNRMKITAQEEIGLRILIVSPAAETRRE